MELKTSGKMLLLSHQKKWKSKQQGLTNKCHQKMAMQEEHIYLPRVTEASWNICTNAARPGMVYRHGSITFSHFTNRMIP
jgi:hypothetical protein